ncbi:MAG TPA: hypothetical protein VKU39_13640 [Streptosporangiaceae bacterium]|nr:hypothetical protein [Streptosporangiaceae bacterium]
MLYAFGFEKVGIVLGDIYFVDPNPYKGQEGAEHGVRVELRVFGRPPLNGSIYSAQPIEVERPIWRADLLESVAGQPGSCDRTHYHPTFSGWDPTARRFVRDLSKDPLGWLGTRLADLEGILAEAGFPADTAAPGDAAELRGAAPEIVEVTGRLLERIRDGKAGTRPADAPASDEAPPGSDTKQILVRSGWL